MRKILFFTSLYGVILLVVFQYKGFLLEWLNESDIKQLPIMLLISVLLSIAPLIPFSVFAGIMGAKYGVWIGSFINWFGSVSAAMIFFILARYFFASEFKTYINRYKSVLWLNDLVQKNSFLAVLFARIIWIVPALIINIYSGISSMSFTSYFFATAIGQLPAMVVFALLGNHLFSSSQLVIQVILIYILFILTVFFLYRRWLKGKSRVALQYKKD